MKNLNEFLLMRDPNSFGVAMYMRQQSLGALHMAEPITLKAVEDGMPATPMIVLGDDDAQGLFNELWRLGFRPRHSIENTQGTIKAMENHLEDMRRLVFQRYATEHEVYTDKVKVDIE